MGFGISGGIIKVTSRKDMPQRPSEPKDPNSRYDFYRNGQLEASTWTDANGIPIKSTHYTNHGNAKTHPQVPHSHDWGWVDGKWTEFKEAY